jgi:hypothetical protein
MVLEAHLHKCLIPYRDLLTTVDRLLYRIRQRYSAQIACRKGCGCGCRNLSIFPIEALSLANALQDLSAGTAARIRKRAANASFWDCPLLEDRRHNFKDMSPIPDDAVIDLDHINGALRTINSSAVSEMARALRLPDRLSIADALLLAGF